MEATLKEVSEEQGGFRKERGYVDQIFSMKMLVEEYLGNDKNCFSHHSCLISLWMGV